MPEYDTEDTTTIEESSEDMGHSSNSDSNPTKEINQIKSNLSPGRVVRRKKHSTTKNTSVRASFPQTRVKDQLNIMNLSVSSHDDDSMSSSTDRLEGELICVYSSEN